MSHFLYCVLDRMVPQKALQCSCYCRREVLYMEESFEQVQEIKAAVQPKVLLPRWFVLHDFSQLLIALKKRLVIGAMP